MDGVALLLLRTASLSPGSRRDPTASLSVAYLVVMSSSSLVVYLMMLFNARKHHGSHAPLPNVFGPRPLGPRLCTSRSPCPP
jgi:hypothetical protein